MKIFIAGGSGRIGQELTRDLVEKGHTVYVGARDVSKIPDDSQAIPVKLDLHGTIDEISKVIAPAEVIYFVAGSRGHDLLGTDLNGAVKLMEASEKNKVTRYIQLSSLFSMEPDKWHTPGMEDLEDYNIAKFYSDKWLINNTRLPYTILQPGNLEETPATGKIDINVTSGGANPIPDVAQTLADLLDYRNTINQTILMHSGNTPISIALSKV